MQEPEPSDQKPELARGNHPITEIGAEEIGYVPIAGRATTVHPILVPRATAHYSLGLAVPVIPHPHRWRQGGTPTAKQSGEN